VLAPSERYWQQQRRNPKLLTDWARQLLLQVQRWFPTRALVVVADGAFSSLQLLSDWAARRRPITCVTRLRLDARLFRPAPPRKKDTIGRPRVVGTRLPSLLQILNCPDTVWRRCDIYLLQILLGRKMIAAAGLSSRGTTQTSRRDKPVVLQIEKFSYMRSYYRQRNQSYRDHDYFPQPFSPLLIGRITLHGESLLSSLRNRNQYRREVLLLDPSSSSSIPSSEKVGMSTTQAIHRVGGRARGGPEAFRNFNLLTRTGKELRQYRSHKLLVSAPQLQPEISFAAAKWVH